MIENDILLRCLKGESVSRPAVWMMRQAGRYLPDFMKLKAKYDFFTRVETPELATEITLMPIHQVGVDAAILFSDILVIPQALGLEVQMVPEKGPVLPKPIRKTTDLQRLANPDVTDRLQYVMQAIKMTKEELNNSVPLIGFAGSPWTIMCYMVQGGGSKTFDLARAFCFKEPKAAHELLDKITETTIEYLKAKVAAGADVIQVFDSWGGVLGPDDYRTFSLTYINRIVKALAPLVPVIVFAKGCWFALPEMAKSGAAALGVDWTCSPKKARELSGGKICLQGNFDPARLLSPMPEIEKRTRKMIDEFGTTAYIANLGHGILPNIPVDHARIFVDTVKNYSTTV